MNQITNSHRSDRLFGTSGYASRNLLALASATIFILCLGLMPTTVRAQNQVLTGNSPTIPSATMTARADASLPLSIHISFAPRNPAMLAKLLVDLQDPASPQYHRWLSATAFNNQFGRSASEISAVSQWLSDQGMSVDNSSPRGITTTATVAQAESTFATTMIATTDGSVYANTNDPQIPARFAGVIASIDGLNNTRHSLAMNIRPPQANAAPARSNTQSLPQRSTSRASVWPPVAQHP